MTFTNVNGKVMPSGPGGWVPNPANVIAVSGAPSTAAVEQQVGTLAVDTGTGTMYGCVNNTGLNGAVTWAALGGAAAAIATINSNAPVAGDYVLAGTANEISVAETAGTSTFSLPATLVAPGSIEATTTLTATLGNITATNGNLVFGTAGNKISSTSVGSAAAAGANSFGTVTLVAGTETVATTAVTANSIIYLSRQSAGATGAAALGQLTVGTITAGASFVIHSRQTADATADQASDVSVVSWMIVN